MAPSGGLVLHVIWEGDRTLLCSCPVEVRDRQATRRFCGHLKRASPSSTKRSERRETSELASFSVLSLVHSLSLPGQRGQRAGQVWEAVVMPGSNTCTSTSTRTKHHVHTLQFIRQLHIQAFSHRLPSVMRDASREFAVSTVMQERVCD